MPEWIELLYLVVANRTSDFSYCSVEPYNLAIGRAMYWWGCVNFNMKGIFGLWFYGLWIKGLFVITNYCCSSSEKKLKTSISARLTSIMAPEAIAFAMAFFNIFQSQPKKCPCQFYKKKLGGYSSMKAFHH